MINRYQIRKLLAPTAGLRWAALMAVGGLVAFFLGFSLSFKDVVTPMTVRLSNNWNTLVARISPNVDVDTVNHALGGVLLALGIYYFVSGIRLGAKRFFETMNPQAPTKKLVGSFVRRQQLTVGPKIVALGGGTGLSTLLRGLKHHSSNISAIVTVTDDGGSSGRLSAEFGIIPPGDIRNCLVALADAEKLMTDLFQHRFKRAKGSLGGHSIGNLLIAGLIEQNDGDMDAALTMASEVLNIRGRVMPSTLNHIQLKAITEDGEEVTGETKIVGTGKRIRRVYLDPPDCEPFADALEAIAEAELIVIGPGSVFTSVIPNLLVPKIAEAINQSKAVKAYVCNVMTQPGESDSFTAAEHVSAIQANVDLRTFDHVLVNTSSPSPSTLDRYRDSGQNLVDPDIDRVRALGFKVVAGNYMSESDYVRHDPLKVAARLVGLLTKF